MKKLIFIFSVLLSFSCNAGNTARFASVFTNNLVLQQKSDTRVWGYASPGETLSIKCSWINQDTKTTTDAAGNWMVVIKTPEAGFEPQSLVLTDSKGNISKLDNILIGEVWLCSGQSNMEMVMQNQPDWNIFVENSEQEIAKADFSNIRVLTLSRKESFTPVDEISSSGWKICNPENARWFSAVAYFFGKELYTKLNVPVGLVVSAYGGSPVQSWIPENITESGSIYKAEQEDRKTERLASAQTEGEYVKAMSEWISHAEENNISVKSENIELILPVNLEKSKIGNQLGEVQFSKTILIPDSLQDKEVHVSLGQMDDFGRVFFNGELVWQEIRNSKSYSAVQFTVPASKVKHGTNLIEARVLNVLWGGGLTGPAAKMHYTIGSSPEKYALTGAWNYKKIFDFSDASPIPHEGKPLFTTASALYNGMINPLLNYGIKGCIWYQGEANVGDELRYHQMLSDLIFSWRTAFRLDFPFYSVQIAPFNYGDGQGRKAAELRESQAKVSGMVPNTGMVVTIDIGDPENVHPAKKAEVGNRLAWMALSETYHKTIRCKYPVVKIAERSGAAIVLKLSNVYKGLVTQGVSTEFEISEDDKKYFPAKAEISTHRIRVSNPQVLNPRHVRYCWRNAAIGTIFNSEKLPLSPFRSVTKNN